MTNTRPLVFIHIPRTAGTSLVEGIGRLCINPASFAPHHLPAAAEGIRAGRYDFINGHFTYAEFVEQCGDDYRFVTFLRDPAERLLSDYAYSTSAKHPGAEEIRADFPTFQRYCAELAFHNTAMRYLALEGETPRQVAQRMRATFMCVGRVETFAQDYARLLGAYGRGQAPMLDLNAVARGEVAENEQAVISKLSARDFELYDSLYGLDRVAA